MVEHVSSAGTYRSSLNQIENSEFGQVRSVDPKVKRKGKSCFCPIRYLMATLAFFGFANVYGMRVNFSITLVEMVAKRNVSTENGTWEVHQEFDWDRARQGLLLSSFFWGYIVTQLPGGLLASRFGGQKIYGFGILITSILTLLTPIVAKQGGYWWILTLRILEGFGEAVTYPSHAAFWSKWAPNLERTKLAGIGFAGSYAGTVIAMPLCGFLAEYLGWESIFYVFGAAGISWTIVWYALASEAPETNRFITEEESRYIITHRDDELESIDLKKVPWKQILTSKAVYAFIVAHFCETWGFYTLLTELPTYMKDVLKFDIQKSGFLSGLPYLILTIMVFVSSYIADVFRERKYLSTTYVRRIWIVIGYSAQAIFLLLTGFTQDASIAVTYLSLGVGLGGIGISSLMVNVLDISPKYSGILMGISNTIATIPGIVSPALSGIITSDKTLIEWRTVFYISSSLYLFGAAFFGAFASGEIQPWSKRSADS